MYKLLILLLLSLPVSADIIRVGSRDFPESVLLAEILSRAIEKNTNLKVDRKFNLGGVKVCTTAINSKSLDIYPDYTGSLMHNMLGERSPAEYLDDYLRSSLEQRYSLILSDKLGYDNNFVLVVRSDYADKHRLKTISNLKQNLDLNLRVAFKPSFIARADGYQQLRRVYGFDFKNLKAMEYNIAYKQLKAGRVDLIDAFSTDARLLDPELRVLVDDRHALLPYESVFVMRKELYEKYPQLAAVIAGLNNSVDNKTIIRLNAKVAAGESYSDVAQQFLAELSLDGLPRFANNGAVQGAERRSNPLMSWLGLRQDYTDILLRALRQHILLSFSALLVSALLGISIGVIISYSQRLASIILGIAAVTQVIPSLALLALLIPILGLGFKPAFAALAIYALLPIIQNTYSGISSIAPEYMDLARSLALSPMTIISRVQLPMAAASIVAGLRTSSVICIGAATLATFVGAGGLGDIIKAGIDLNSNSMIVLGALPAAMMALGISYILSLIEKKF